MPEFILYLLSSLMIAIFYGARGFFDGLENKIMSIAIALSFVIWAITLPLAVKYLIVRLVK